MYKQCILGMALLLMLFLMYAIPSQTEADNSDNDQFIRLAMPSGEQTMDRAKLHSESSLDQKNKAKQDVKADANPVRELVIIDQGVPDKHLFYLDIKTGVEIKEIAIGQDGLTQLDQILGQYKNLNALHIVSHATDGHIHIGNRLITAQTLTDQIKAFDALNNVMNAGADLLFYGCNLASSKKSQDFLALISDSTHLDIATSTNLTGSVKLGGDWALEYQRGDIQTTLPFNMAALSNYNYVLTTFDWGGLGNADSDSSGFRSLTNTNLVVSNTFNQDATTELFWNADVSSATMVIKADNVDAESFDVSVINVYGFANETPSFDATSTLVFKDKNGATLRTMTLNGDKSILHKNGGTPTDLFAFFDNNNTSPVTGVASITLNHVAADVANANKSNNINFKNITITNITAPSVTPTITNVTYDSSNGNLVVTGTNFEAKSGGSNDITVNKLKIIGEGGNGAEYTLTSATNIERDSATQFTVPISGVDKLRVDALLNKDSTTADDGTTYNLATLDDFVANITSGDTAIATNAITVSNYANPSFETVTYDASIGRLVVTGQNLSMLNSGGNNDVVANTFTLTGDGGDIYLLTTTSNVDITSASEFTIDLSAADKHNVNGILNANGLNAASGQVYNLAAADNWLAGGPPNVNIADSAATINVSNVTAPAITSVAYNNGTGVLTVTGTNFVNKVGTGDVVVGNLTLTGEGGNNYTLTTGNVEITDATTFAVTLNAADKLVVNGLLNKDGVQADDTVNNYNLNAAEDYMPAVATATNIVSASNGVTVSNLQLPTITDAIYNAGTKVLVVTGTNFARKFGGNDIDPTKLVLTGEASGTYTLTSTGVEVDSATQFTLTISDTDKINVNGLLNKDGVQADDNTTNYNLAGNEDWQAGAGTNAVIADTAGNGVTVSGSADPTVSSATYNATTGVLAVIGTRLVKKTGTSNDVDLTKITLKGQANGTRALTTTNVEITDETSFSVTLNAGDKTAVDALLNLDGTQSGDSIVYNLNAAENWMAGAATNNNIVDAINGITVSGVPVPEITSSTYDSSTGILEVTGANFENKSGGTNDVSVSKLTITGQGGGGSAYTLTGADVEITNATTFSVTLTGTDKNRVNAILNKNGSQSDSNVTYNLAAADDFMANVTAGNTADATATITVSNYAAPAITDATYNAGTGALVVTGTGFSSLSGSNNDVDPTAITITGDGDDTYVLTTTGVDITNDTTFTVNLNATDMLTVNGLLNKNGEVSPLTTIYNLAAADNWMAGGAPNSNIQDLTSNGITVSGVVNPTITSATYDATSGALVVTGTNFTHKVGPTNDVVVTQIALSGHGNFTYLLTGASVEITDATTFTVNLSATDIFNANGLFHKNGTLSDNNSNFLLQLGDNWLAAGPEGDIADISNNTVTVSNVVEPAVTSATYDTITGVLAVTGTRFVSQQSSADVTVNLLTLKGEGGVTYTLTTSSVEIASATSFSVTLNTTDKLTVNSLLNKDGTQADDGATNYNLNAADNYMVASADSSNIADATNTITVSNVAVPTITSATYDYSTGVLVVTGTSLSSTTGSNNDIDITKLTLTGQGGGTHQLTTGNVDISNETAFTVTLNDADKLAVNGLLNKDGASSGDNTTYNLAAAENWLPGAASNAVIADLTVNGITVSNVVQPVITDATYDASTGALVVTGTNFTPITGGTNDVDPTKFTLTGDSGGSYVLTTTAVEITNATTFTVTLNSTDKTNLNGLLNKDGTQSDSGTTYNLAAADNWMAGANSSTDIADLTSNSITVNNVTTPVITDATYNAVTGELVVSGTNFVNEVGSTNDVDPTKFTLTGDSGDTYVLTTTGIEITNKTTFAVILNTTDKTNIDGLLNKNGTQSDSGTTYNLAVADNWMPGAAATTDIADATGNGITVSNVTVPAITSSTYNYSTGALVVTGTNFRNKNGAINDVDITKLTLKGEGSNAYVLTTTNVEITSATEFSVTLNNTDSINVNGLLNKNGTNAEDNTVYNLAAADNWMPGVLTATDISDTTVTVTVSNVTTPTIASVAYDVSTGIVTVTGTNFLKKFGATNDVDISLLTFTGENGDNYTIVSTTDVEITSSTTFTITLSGADKTSVDALLNKDGLTSISGATYNLEVADNWLPGTAASTNIADTTNGITVSNVPIPGYWIGTASSDWNNGANWDDGNVPTNLVNVLIRPSSHADVTNQPTVNITNAASQNLTIEDGATLTISTNGNILTVSGNYTKNGTGSISASNGGKVVINGDVFKGATLRLNISATGSIEVLSSISLP